MSDLSKVPQFNRLFRLQFEPAQDSFVLLFPEGMVKLNPSAGAILEQVDGDSSVAGIINKLQSKFPEAGDLTPDVCDFLITAEEKKWIYYA
ncbi:pyrroloquinoline quinone biosynthesis peptide chaperone PqqD [Psychrobium sp. 1_MG-2023]|uniref:pyrroloquinoline quinone biosynthesis peptide chaperone PqqD n=1 Tax=Psychrobium sp. 1_MG-2023 TaxID=3062624 RepID=UPI000C32DD57|nr:pyrroloquinoline quinone biosynthesis peptide chaperone PqqD [Psychrobium sp. 1_MG-2023]MDP2561572.1 pyrroloquinoline quinone biosynthesis peptide chaperone PqqD [Psychrobium sp. 1_MG-2023]PKF55033.1 pyrroloquinoline quinone biosynthesis peptide chaperone PqqD [Alteromonadales bacterium alter-6D02]